MTANPSAREIGRIRSSERSADPTSRPRHRRIRTFTGEQISAKLYSVGFQAAISIVLSVIGLGSAMGQSMAPDTAPGATTQVRVVSGIRPARVGGTAMYPQRESRDPSRVTRMTPEARCAVDTCRSP